MNKQLTAVILAAGDGKRMKSPHPKVLCEVLFTPMLLRVASACKQAGIPRIIIVAGAHKDALEQVVPSAIFVEQHERLGTGHALMMAKPHLNGGQVLVLNGDSPLLTPETITDSLAAHQAQNALVTVLTASVENPTGYGRIVRGDALSIIEEKDADDATRLIHEVNGGFYWMDGAFLDRALVPGTFCLQNAQKEYYITDLLTAAQRDGGKVVAYLCPDCREILGANDPVALAHLNRVARDRVIERHLMAGVNIPLSDGILIGEQVQIAPGTTILPGTMLLGDTVIGSGCEIGPQSRLENAKIGDNSQIKASWLTDCSVGNGCSVGPFAQFRPNTHLGSGVKVGDFVELKNTTIGDETSVAHLTYLGDCDIGSHCNFGCGVVTANYDGKKKYRTTVGDRAFIGCNTNLISPVCVGEGAYTAAGTTIDRDVPAGALAIGRCRQEVKQGWADEKIAFKK